MEIATIALVAAITAVGVTLVFWRIAARAKPSFDARLQRSGAFAAPIAPGEVIARLRDGAGAQKLTVALLDEAGNRIILSEPITLTSYGTFILVTAEPAGGDTKVTVGLKTKVPQYGPIVGKHYKRVSGKVMAILGIAA